MKSSRMPAGTTIRVLSDEEIDRHFARAAAIVAEVQEQLGERPRGFVSSRGAGEVRR